MKIVCYQMVSDKMTIYFDVFGLFMKHVILYCPMIVTMKRGGKKVE